MHFCKHFHCSSSLSAEDSITTESETTSSHDDTYSTTDTISDSGSDYSGSAEDVITVLTNATWDFTSMKDTIIVNSGKGPSPLWELSYPSQVSLMNGQYYRNV